MGHVDLSPVRHAIIVVVTVLSCGRLGFQLHCKPFIPVRGRTLSVMRISECYTPLSSKLLNSPLH